MKEFGSDFHNISGFQGTGNTLDDFGSGEDNLYKFKAAFNKVSDFQFSIGKQVFNQELYDELMRIRRESDPGFDETSHYFPVYRA